MHVPPCTELFASSMMALGSWMDHSSLEAKSSLMSASKGFLELSTLGRWVDTTLVKLLFTLGSFKGTFFLGMAHHFTEKAAELEDRHFRKGNEVKGVRFQLLHQLSRG